MNLSIHNEQHRRRWSLCVSVIANSAILAIALIFSNMEFGTNDDRDISNLLADVYGTDKGHYITFVNVILGKVLSLLYRITNNAANWYILFSLAASYISLVSICYLLTYRSRNLLFGAALSAILAGLLYESHYITFQFTQNAALITMAGILLLTDLVLHGWENGSLLQGVLGIVLTLFGSLIRFQSIYFTFPYLLMFVGYELVFLRKKFGFGIWFHSRWKAFICIAISVFLVFAARGIHNYTYQSDPVLKEFYEENLLRVELLDYGFPSYEENAEQIHALGLTEDDITLFSAQFFLDKEVFSRETLEALVAMKTDQTSSISLQNFNPSFLLDVLRSIRADMSENLFWQILGAFFAIFILCTRRKRWLVAFGCMLAPVAMVWYFTSVNRLPYRVWYSILAPAVISMIYLYSIDFRRSFRKYERKRINFSKIFSALAVCLMCIAVMLSVLDRAREDDSVKITDYYERVLALADEYPDKLILLDRPTISVLTYNSTITPTTCLARGSHHNICYQGGWICWTPANLSALSNHDIDNVYRSISEGLEVILVDARTPDLKLSYIQRHYNPDVCMELISVIGNIGVYRLYIP